MCPSCTTRRMAEIAAHLTDHVFPQVPVRQWVVTFPKRVRFFLHRDPALLWRVLRAVLRTIEMQLRRASPGAPPEARFGAVTFVQRFGSALNAHTHFHCCVTDGLFSAAAGTLRFHPITALTDADLAAVQHTVRTCVLRACMRHGALSGEAAEDLGHWAHGGGFSVHAAVRIEADDRRALERLLRYCARPALASERLSTQGADGAVRYTLPKPLPTGESTLTLSPLEFLDRLATFIPPPRRHRHHYHGAFAPHATLRSLVTAWAAQPLVARDAARSSLPSDTEPSWPSSQAPAALVPPTPSPRRRASYLWAHLIARIYECLPLLCPRCHGEMRLIAFITDPLAIRSILEYLGEPPTPPPLARAPPPLFSAEFESCCDQTPAGDLTAPAPDPGFEFDQTRSA